MEPGTPCGRVGSGLELGTGVALEFEGGLCIIAALPKNNQDRVAEKCEGRVKQDRSDFQAARPRHDGKAGVFVLLMLTKYLPEACERHCQHGTITKNANGTGHAIYSFGGLRNSSVANSKIEGCVERSLKKAAVIRGGETLPPPSPNSNTHAECYFGVLTGYKCKLGRWYLPKFSERIHLPGP